MIRIEHPEVWGWEHAIRGMRNPMNSWAKSDSVGDTIGENDLALMRKLIRGGAEHRKFLRQVFVSVDITAPLYWWKEADTYKVGTTANSTSTMHKIHAKEFEISDFSHEHIHRSIDMRGDEARIVYNPMQVLCVTINTLNAYRELFLDTHDKAYWWQLIQLLPSSYNQRRTVTLNYENLLSMYHQRKNHKLDEWRAFCDWIMTLPHARELFGEEDADGTRGGD